jgi:hypothetical protein
MLSVTSLPHFSSFPPQFGIQDSTYTKKNYVKNADGGGGIVVTKLTHLGEICSFDSPGRLGLNLFTFWVVPSSLEGG